MNKTVASMLGIAFALAGLGCDQPIENSTASGPAPLTAEEQAVVDNMAKNTLAEIDLPEGKMVFIEEAPGEVSVMRQIRIGADVTRVEGADKMELDQLFRAYAPGQEAPAALVAAMDRVHAAQRSGVTESPAVQGADIMLQGDKPVSHDVVNADGTERVSSALASAVDQAWFTSALCSFSGTSSSWCFTTAYINAYARRTSHRANAAVCGDTGAAQVKRYVSGTLRTVVDVPYGVCWNLGTYTSPHDFFGSPLKRTIETKISWAESTIRFSGWFADGEQFISAF